MTLLSPENSNSSRNAGWLIPLLLVLVLIIGAVFRLTGVNWDEDQHLHPDERFLTMVESSLSLPGEAKGVAPQGCVKWGGYFSTPCSPLNPYNHNFGLFVYGTFPIFLTNIVADVLNKSDYGNVHLVGRVLSALFDLSTILLVFFIGKRLYGSRAAILSSLFLASSVLDIQQSHFFTVDTFTNVPILLSFWFALDIADGKSWHSYVWAGIMFGLSLAGRINIALFAVVFVAAAALRVYRVTHAERLVHNALAIVSSHALLALVLCAVAALVTFRLAQPYAANGPNFISPVLPKLDISRGGATALMDLALSWAGGVNTKFADNMAYVGDLVAGKADYPPGHQWTDRTPYIFPLQNMVLWGLGLPLGIAAWAGFLIALYRLIRFREWQHLLIVMWVGITFVYSGQQFVKTMRYFLQIYPFLCLLGAYFLIWLWEKANGQSHAANRQGISKVSVAIAAIIVIGYTLFYAAAFTSIYTRPVSRVTASRWMFDHIPVGSVVANEHWDDPLPLRVDGKDPFGGMYRGLKSSPDGLMGWYGEDTPEKRTAAIQWINDAQYIVLSSNRLYLSIPRLPMRYPMTTKYYQWLFDGTLDFDLVATFTSHPQLFGIEINDDDAEEIFTVYDHPKVLIFQKNARYDPSKTAALFNGVSLNEVYQLWPLQATQSKTALLLTDAERTAQQAGGTWRYIFDPSDFINRIPVVAWLAMVEILGWIAFPLAFITFRGLADRGYIFSKALGLLLPAWIAWLLASFHIAPFGRWSIGVAIAVVAITGLIIATTHWHELRTWARANRAAIWGEEILFLAFFGLFLAIRFGNPDLWHPNFGGEKPMDFAYLNAIIKSTWMPPYDPWFAGGYINYYYFGQFITATLVKFSGVVPEIAYNLTLPMFFALTAMGAFSVVLNLIVGRTPRATDVSHSAGRSPFFFALLAAIFVAIIGNLGELALVFETFAKIGAAAPSDIPILGSGFDILNGMFRVLTMQDHFDIPTGWWYWNATRVIPDTINEFPFFTFLYADLHAHLMSLAFTLLVLGFAINYALREDTSSTPFPENVGAAIEKSDTLEPSPSRGKPARFLAWLLTTLYKFEAAPSDILEIVLAALALGALRAINYADFFPTYTLLVLAALCVGEYGRRRRINMPGVIAVGWRFGAIYALTSILYQPFISHFATAYLATDLWSDKRTKLGEYLIVHGIFFFMIATFLVTQTYAAKSDRGAFRFLRLAFKRSVRLDRALNLHQAFVLPPNAYQDFASIILAGAVIVEIMLMLVGWWVFVLVIPFLALASLLVVRPNLDPSRRFVALLIATGLALTLMVELVTYKGDIGRMNTVFKFYLQVWVFLGIAAAFAVGEFSTRVTRSGLIRTIWWGVFGLLVLAGMLYPVFAARAKIADRFVPGSPPGLNGMDYMSDATYYDRDKALPLKFDREAVDWLRLNVDGSPVILEGNAPLYHWGSRVSIYTGLPTVIGWDWHQKQQRSIIDGGIIDRRIATVADIYNTRDQNRALGQLKRFDVKYVYVGDMERAFYEKPGLDKFDGMVKAGMLEVVYQNDRVKIYRLIA